MHRHPMELQVTLYAGYYRIFESSFGKNVCKSEIFASGPRVNPIYAKEFIKFTLKREGTLYIPTSVASSTANPRCHG
jgi:hypothetical protein